MNYPVPKDCCEEMWMDPICPGEMFDLPEWDEEEEPDSEDQE